MRHPVIWTVLGAAAVIVPKLASKAAPAVRARCSQACERMLAKMPESFHPTACWPTSPPSRSRQLASST